MRFSFPSAASAASAASARLLVVAVALLTLSLSACDPGDINARKQSGVWTIRRVTVTYTDTLGTVLTTQTVTDAGEVAFINITGQLGSVEDEARFYFDKDVPGRVMQALRTGAAGTSTACEWLSESYDRRRILLQLVTDDPFAGLEPIVLTLAAETDATQRWQYVQSAGDYIVYREEWDVERVQ